MRYSFHSPYQTSLPTLFFLFLVRIVIQYDACQQHLAFFLLCLAHAFVACPQTLSFFFTNSVDEKICGISWLANIPERKNNAFCSIYKTRKKLREYTNLLKLYCLKTQTKQTKFQPFSKQKRKNIVFQTLQIISWLVFVMFIILFKLSRFFIIMFLFYFQKNIKHYEIENNTLFFF